MIDMPGDAQIEKNKTGFVPHALVYPKRSMGHRKMILALLTLLALVLCGVLAVVFWPRKPEPVYEGRKLSKCILGAARRGRFAYADLNAIQVIGTNGIPYYLRWISY